VQTTLSTHPPTHQPEVKGCQYIPEPVDIGEVPRGEVVLTLDLGGGGLGLEVGWGWFGWRVGLGLGRVGLGNWVGG